MNHYYFKNYLDDENIHSETYLDNKLLLVQNGQINEIPYELNNCLCCFKHSNNIMSLNLPKCKCPCRHFKRIIDNKLLSLSN